MTIVLPSEDGPMNKLGLPGVLLVAELLTVGAAVAALSVVETEAETEAVAMAEADSEETLAMMAEASAGEIVVVLVEVLAEAITVELPLLLEDVTPPFRTSWPSAWGWVSMKAIVGPATNWDEARSRTLLRRGWLSDVIQIATGPLIPSGTMHWLIGREIDIGVPPNIIWQNNFCTSMFDKSLRNRMNERKLTSTSWETVPLRAEEENDRTVPGPTDPVFVMVNVGLAGIPRSQAPSKNGATMERTSSGLSAISKAAGIAVPLPDMMFNNVWWRASTVKIVPAAARRTVSVMRVAPPRYAITPTFSTTRAVETIVATSVSTESKLNLQLVIGVSPKDCKASCRTVEWVDSSPWIILSCSTKTVLELKPTETKSCSWNFWRAWE